MTTAKVSIQAPPDPSFRVNADGTDYRVDILMFNSDGELRQITSQSFESVSFETMHTTPFLFGRLTLNNNENSELNNIIRGIDISDPDIAKFTQMGTKGGGQDFLRIKIFIKRYDKKSCKFTDVEIVDKFFTIKATTTSVQNNQKVILYDFIDIVYSHFARKLDTWSTDIIPFSPEFLNQYTKDVRSGKKTVEDQTREQNELFKPGREIRCGWALKHLLINFSEDHDIVGKPWDNGISTLSYTLPAGSPPILAINEIMSKYVSTDQSSGVLTYYNGQFQLRSLKSILNNVYKDTNNNTFKLSSDFAGAFKIETDDLSKKFTNNRNVELFGKSFQYIPIKINNVDFTEVQPDETVTNLHKQQPINYNPSNKKITIHNKNGKLKNQGGFTKNLPDEETNTVNIDQNNLFSRQKTILFDYTTNTTTGPLGDIALERRLLNSLTKAEFTVGGNINMSANKIIYMTVDLSAKNRFITKIPGFWYVTKNYTILNKETFSSTIECRKLDKPQ